MNGNAEQSGSDLTNESFVSRALKKAEQAVAKAPEERKAAVREFQTELIVKLTEEAEQEQGFFWTALAGLRAGRTPQEIFRKMYEKSGKKYRYEKMAMRARFKSFSEDRLATEGEWFRAEITREKLDKLFEISGGKATGAGGSQNGSIRNGGNKEDGNATRVRRRRVSNTDGTVEQGSLLTGVSSAGNQMEIKQNVTEESHQALLNAHEIFTSKDKLTKTEDGAFIIPIQGCRVDLTGERIAMTSFGVEKRVLDEAAAAERARKVNDLVEQFAAELKTRGYEVDKGACGALARLRAAFDDGRAVGCEGFLALSKKPQLRDVYRDTMGSEHWADVEAALKRLGLAGE